MEYDTFPFSTEFLQLTTLRHSHGNGYIYLVKTLSQISSTSGLEHSRTLTWVRKTTKYQKKSGTRLVTRRSGQSKTSHRHMYVSYPISSRIAHITLRKRGPFGSFTLRRSSSREDSMTKNTTYT